MFKTADQCLSLPNNNCHIQGGAKKGNQKVTDKILLTPGLYVWYVN